VRGWREVLPGAAVATILWWGANSAFGFYVRRMKYNVVYGGLAAAIGLLVWMQLTAMIVFFGAAFNAEVLAQGSGDAGAARLSPAAPRALGADTSVPEE
jgi:membrane protein